MMQAMRNPKMLKWGLYLILIVAIPSFIALGPNFDSSNSSTGQELDFAEIQTQDGQKSLRNSDLRAAQERATRENASIFGMVTGNQQYGFQAYQLLPSYYNENRKVLAEYAVGSEALREMARTADLTVTPELVSKSLAEQFPSQQELDNFTANSGMTQKQIVSEVSDSLLLEMGQMQIVNIARASILESWLAYKNTNDQLEARFVTIPTADLQSKVELTEEEVSAYFTKNAENYIDPEKRIYRYVTVLSPAQVPPVNVTDFDILNYYNSVEKVGNPLYAAPVGKLVRHITLNISDENTTDTLVQQLTEITQLLKDGGDFTQIANQFSQDPANINFGSTTDLLGGIVPGNLNETSEAEFVERYGQAWVDAVKALEPGQLSGVIMGNNMVAIAEVTGLSDGIMTLENASPIIEALLREEKQKEVDQLTEARNEEINALEAKIKRIAAESTTLESIAGKLETSVGETSPTVSTSTFIRPLGNMGEYREYLTELQPNIPSQVLRAGGTDNFVILEVKEIIPSRPQTLEEVRLVVESAIRREKASVKAKEIAEQIAAIARTAEDGIDSAMQQLTEYTETYLVNDTKEPFGRLAPPAELRNFQSLGSATFRSKEGDVLVLRSGTEENAGEYVVLELTAVKEPSKEEFLNEIGSLEQQLTGIKQITYVQEFRKDAPDLLKPKYNKELLEPAAEERSTRRRRGRN